MDTNESKLLQAIHAVDRKVAGLESTIAEAVNIRFVENERRIQKTENNLTEISKNIIEIQQASSNGKLKWVDDILKFIVLAIISYVLVRAGLK